MAYRPECLRYVSFSSCGWAFAFHAGVAQALLDKGALRPDVKVHGASGGACVAMILLNDMDGVVPFTESLAGVVDIMDEVKLNVPKSLTNAHELLCKFWEGYPIDKDAHKRLSGRLHISITKGSGEGVIVNQFSSNDDLRDALLTGAYIPVAFRRPARIWGGLKAAFDGGFSENVYEFVSGAASPTDETLVSSVQRLPFWASKKARAVHIDVQPSPTLSLAEQMFPNWGRNKFALYGEGYGAATAWLRTQRVAVERERRAKANAQ